MLGIPITGLHTNGYSLARRIAGLTGDHVADRAILDGTILPDGTSLGAALMAPHRSYLADVRPLLESGLVRGMAHITGGGLKDNLPRSLPANCIARLDPGTWPSLPIFDYLVERGAVAAEERFRVFNMGIGFVVVARAEDRDTVLAAVPESRQVGEIVSRSTTHEAPVQGLSC